ncbi:helix-turn-helix domain-containing protein [Rugamonas sp. FT82W]|uniref:Helix-turn-helix domain-containing protein n=1 Tax=Duganella vulcania TaxID=2692166 RepID=A0A845FX70_9BURK|nr:helix-turn-helix domain-containing protein [Duganella vulcania]MYM85832.1 helix-turn-helix domain-containing protein [Duganella vulcania]
MTTKKSLPLSDEELEAFETTRDLYLELKQAAKDIQAGLGNVVYSPVIAARKSTGLTSAEFAKLLGVSVRTLEDWEQGRQQPEGAALTLLSIALDNPEALLAAKVRYDEAPLK